MDTLEIVRLVRKEIQIPLGVKIYPYYTNVGNMAQRFQAAGVNGLALFNRFLQPDIDVENFEIKRGIQLGTSRDNRLALSWIAFLYNRLKLDLAATGGVMEARGSHSVDSCRGFRRYGLFSYLGKRHRIYPRDGKRNRGMDGKTSFLFFRRLAWELKPTRRG